MYKQVNQKQSFPEMENDILKYWKENKIFEESIHSRENSDEFSFYDGPPFATGTPHYGHILAWTIKDVIPRYQTMQWHKVKRVFGWDCHWLPIENIVEKKLNISWKDDIENKVWIYDFNETCRNNVLTFTEEWKKTVDRTGRWVDMENAYHTMDTNFMESVWWVFKSIYDKWLIYEWNRVVPYCPRCTTPLSNFEVNQWYKDKQSKTVTVKFKVKWSENKYILAWTTTPWTLYANLWLAVWKDIVYVEIKDKQTDDTYILAKERLDSYYKDNEEYSILKEYPWECLVWIKYEALFPDIKTKIEDMWENLWVWIELWKKAFSVVLWHHVTTDSWTWIVHIAPAYWEDDNIIWKNEDLWFISHIWDDWKTCNLIDKNSIFVFDFNEEVIKEIKESNYHIHIWTIDHSYPHCWRCDTPLIYRAISAWYVAVEKIRDKMIANNEKITWVPEVIKHWRFGKWISEARDWNISRNRYWWSAMPVWQSEDKKEEVCIWSIEELYQLNKEYGQIEKKWDKYYFSDSWKEVDIHKHFVDEIFLKHPKTWTKLKRIPEVLDCWFESGSMPYASKHYPFSWEEEFKFPADFIAEWLDQTRGWFYTLLILWTALFDKPPFLNCIVNGIVLAEDWKKMSKKLQNYPDPKDILDKYWADAMRFYLMNSPVVAAEDFRFVETWVEEVVKKVILPLWNTYSFFTTYANIDWFEKEKWDIYFIRHWESITNIAFSNSASISWSWDNPGLTDKWVEDTKKMAKKARSWWIKFDRIYSSPMDRCIDTAKIFAEEIWFKWEVIILEELKEQNYSDFEWMSHHEIADKYWIDRNDTPWIRKIYKNSKVENYKDYDEKVSKAVEKIESENKWKNILIVAHAWTYRPIAKKYLNLDLDFAHLEMPTIKNSSLIKMPSVVLNNPLDKWVFSELNNLILDVTDWLDNYRVNDAARSITKFMDNLTNWYIRRSRKRFWKSENDWDKIEAYNTLHHVIIELSKAISPFMPFVSEEIFRNLTGKKSIHLEMFAESNKAFILRELNSDMDLTQKIITLWLAARANAKIRVRQPLKQIEITEKLSQYYIDIIKEELNVKEVVNFDIMPSQICKPIWRNIWPKFWKDVKFIISEAKTWNFTMLENWNVKVWDFELEQWDFELEYMSMKWEDYNNESVVVLESWFWTVIWLETSITEELKLEWYARDIVRYIQEARKEAEYSVDDRIEINILWADEILSSFKEYIESETLSTLNRNINTWDINKQIDIEELKVELILKK